MDDARSLSSDVSASDLSPRFQHSSAQSLIKNVKPETVTRPSMQTPRKKALNNVAGASRWRLTHFRLHSSCPSLSGIDKPNATLVGYKKLNTDNKPIMELGTFSPKLPETSAAAESSVPPTPRSAVGGSLPELRSASTLHQDVLRRNTMLHLNSNDVASDDDVIRRRLTIAGDRPSVSDLQPSEQSSDVTVANLKLSDDVSKKLSLVDTDDDVSFKTALMPTDDDDDEKWATPVARDSDADASRRHALVSMLHAHSEPTLVQLSDITLTEKDETRHEESEAVTSDARNETSTKQTHSVVTSQPPHTSDPAAAKRSDSVKSLPPSHAKSSAPTAPHKHCTITELLKEEFALGLHEDTTDSDFTDVSSGRGLGMRKNLQRLTSRGSMTSSSSSPEFVARKRKLVSPVQDEVIV